MTHPDEVRMTFGEHLEELRARILFSLLFFILAFVVCFAFQHPLAGFFFRPFLSAQQSIRERMPELAPGEYRLAWRLRDQGVLSQQDLVDLGLDKATYQRDPKLISVGATETFMAYFKIALLTAAIASAPMLLYQMWRFVGVGLYQSERRLVVRVLPFSLLLFGGGGVFGFLVLVPVSLDFLLSYGDPALIQQHVTVSSYLALLFLLLFVMGLVFQVPLVMTILTALGIVEPKAYRAKRKFFVLGAVVVAALLTPPDYVTQILVATPTVLLYELGIGLAYLTARSRRRRQAAAGQPSGGAA